MGVSRIGVSHRPGKQEEQKNPRLGLVRGLINNFLLFHYVYKRCALLRKYLTAFSIAQVQAS